MERRPTSTARDVGQSKESRLGREVLDTVVLVVATADRNGCYHPSQQGRMIGRITTPRWDRADQSIMSRRDVLTVLLSIIVGAALGSLTIAILR